MTPLSRAAFRLPAPSGPSRNALRIRCDLAYDGTRYAGWQIQPDRPSIQGALEETWHQLTGEHSRFHASGRTDAGVHARAQVAHVDLKVPRATKSLLMGLNALLPSDIRVLRVRRVPSTFHARFSAIEKEYRYFIWNASVLDPFLRSYRAHERRPLDLPAMQDAAHRLEGRHDFAAFSANPNREIEGTVRTLYTLQVHPRGREMVLTARGDGFLYKMVRSLAGFLLRVGSGELAPDTADTLLASCLRTARVPTAPAQGLFLWRVRYTMRRPEGVIPR